MNRPVIPISQAVRSAAAPAATTGPAGSAEIAKPYIRATIETASVVEEGGFLIVPVVFATETPVRRFNYRYNDYEGEYFDEVLSTDAAHVRLERINTAGPVLDSHNKYGSVSDVVLGKVVAGSARIVGQEIHARLQMSNRPELSSLRQDIKDGIVSSISVGYDVETFTREESVTTNAVPIYRATVWEPTEISFVPVPADINSAVRGGDTSPPKNSLTINMKYGTRQNGPLRDPGATSGESGGAAIPAAAPAATSNPAAAPATPAAPAEPAAPEAPAAAERGRILGIQSAVRTFGLPETLAERLVNSGVSLDGARAQIQTEFAAADPTRQIVGASVNGRAADNNVEAFARSASAGMLMRARQGAILSDTERAAGAEFAGMSLLRLAEECLRMANVDVRGMSSRQVAQRALQSQGRAATGMLTTSDLPYLLGSIIQRTLRVAYAAAASTFEEWTSRGTLNDFRTTHRVSMSELLQDFAKVAEGGEYTYNTVGETSEAVRLAKYGTIIPISWEAIINDDMSAFSRLPTAAARKSKNLQSDLVYGLLTGNTKMNDGFNLFSTEHGNLAATGSALSVASLGVATKAFRTQKAPGEKTAQLNLRPKFLIVGPELEQSAIQFLSGLYVPTKQTDINIYQSTLKPIVEARITDKGWYLAADPAEIDTIEVNFLSGEPELFTEERWSFDRDAYETKARTVVGVAPIDWRGLYKNTGAA